MKIWALFVNTGSCVYNKKNLHVSYKHRLQASVVLLSGLPNDLEGRASKLVHLIAKHQESVAASDDLSHVFTSILSINPNWPGVFGHQKIKLFVNKSENAGRKFATYKLSFGLVGQLLDQAARTCPVEEI